MRFALPCSDAPRVERNLSVPGSDAAPRPRAGERRDDSSLDSRAMETRYEPGAVEARWQETWEREGLYAAEPDDAASTPSSSAIPPPNVTGELHLGHALNGRSRTCSSAGTACGVSTRSGSPGTTTPASQHRTSWRGRSREKGSRDTTSDATRSSSERGTGSSTTAASIYGQFRRLGASLDYSPRTLHDGRRLRPCRPDVLRAALGRPGSLYRDNRIVNWCPRSTSGDLRSRGQPRRRGRPLFTIRYPSPTAPGRRSDGRDSPAADDARRRRSGRAPGRRALSELVGREAIVPVTPSSAFP